MAAGNGFVVIGLIHRADSTSPQKERCLRMLMAYEFSRRPVRLIGEFDRESSANVSHARCAIVEDFLTHPKQPEWLLLLDSDMTFGPDLIDELVDAADPVERPIVGGLCFGVRPVKDTDGREHFNACGGSPLELFPTVYTLDEEGGMRMVYGYPRGEVFQAHSTGAACLLIHRSVVNDSRWKVDGHPLPWFRESVMSGRLVSEDQFFCLKAGSMGFPVHINARARTGHVKVFIADEDLYLAQRASLGMARAASAESRP